MRLVRRALPFWAANLMQAVLFGIFHMNWIQGIYAFVLGLVLGWICEKGGSIYFSMFFHILFNFWGTIIGPLLNNLKLHQVLDIHLMVIQQLETQLPAKLYQDKDVCIYGEHVMIWHLSLTQIQIVLTVLD